MELDTYRFDTAEGEIMTCNLARSIALIQVKNIKKANKLTLNNLPPFLVIQTKHISEFWDFVEAAIKHMEVKNGEFVFDDNFDSVEAGSLTDKDV